MLSGREYTSSMHSVHKRNAFFSNILFIFSKRTVTNNWVFWIGVDVHIRRKIDVHPKSFCLLSYAKSNLFNQPIILDSTKGHIPWKWTNRIQTHGYAPFGIHSNEQGRSGFGLEFIQPMGLPHRISQRKNNTANMIFNNFFFYLVEMCFPLFTKGHHHEELSYFLVER